MNADNASKGITLRSIVLGLVLIPINGVYLVASEILWLTSAPTALSLFYNVIFVLFWLVAVNLLLRRFKPSWALGAGELLVVYTMLSISSAVCSIDMLDVLLPAMSHLYHFQPIEQQYDEVMAHVPLWLVVQDDTALKGFYLGQESIFDPAMALPWIKPLSIWFLFIIALLAVMGGLVMLLRLPWTKHEPLAYPIIQVPMLMVTQTEALFRSRLFWTGFATVAAIDFMNGLNFFYPNVPHLPLVKVLDIVTFLPERPWSAMGRTMVSFYPFAIALCFFMPTDLVFSCWFFYFVFKLQRVAANYFGVHGMSGFPYINEQTCGGYYALAFVALWICRRHLLRAGRLLLGLPCEENEPGERMEMRTAFLLISSGFAFLVLFSTYHGMAWWMAVAFFVSYFLVAVAITRMRAELGYLSHDLHFIGPQFQIVNFMGQPEMVRHYPRELVLFGLYHFFTRAYRSHPMPHGLEALRIAERLDLSRKRYLVAMALAAIFGILGGYWAILYVFTKYGASNVSMIGEWLGRETWTFVNRWFTAPEKYMPYPTYATIIGMLVGFGLAVLRMNLVWWPLHPVGYAVSGSWSMDQLWMCFLTAWTIKVILLRYGGAKMFRAIQPLLVGVILGDFITGNGWTIFGLLTEQDVYHFWPY